MEEGGSGFLLLGAGYPPDLRGKKPFPGSGIKTIERSQKVCEGQTAGPPPTDAHLTSVRHTCSLVSHTHVGVILRLGGRRAARGGHGGGAVGGHVLFEDSGFVQPVFWWGVSGADSRGGWVLQGYSRQTESESVAQQTERRKAAGMYM